MAINIINILTVWSNLSFSAARQAIKSIEQILVPHSICTWIPFRLQDRSLKSYHILVIISFLIKLELTENMTIVYVTQPPTATPKGKLHFEFKSRTPQKSPRRNGSDG